MIDIKSPSDLQNHVLSAPLAVLDFWAPWCGPCRMVAPVLAKLEEHNPNLVVAKVNVEENKELAASFGIRSIPTLIFFKNGQAHTTLLGAHPLERLQQQVDAL